VLAPQTGGYADVSEPSECFESLLSLQNPSRHEPGRFLLAAHLSSSVAR